MNLNTIKSGLLDSTAQIITFTADGKFIASCDTLFQITGKIRGSLFDRFPVLESLQQSFAELGEGHRIKLPCMWFSDFDVAGYYDFTFTKIDGTIVWLLQDFDEIYKNQIPVQQERNESIINSELLELHRKTKERLTQIEKEYSYLFTNTLDLIQSIDSQGRYLFTNPAWKKTLGYSETDLAGMTFLDIIHPDDKTHCQKLFDDLATGKCFKEVEVRLLGKKGQIVYVQGSLNAKVENNKFISTQGIFKDISRRKAFEEKLKQSEALYRLLVENASDIIFMTDPQGKIIFMNNVGLEFTGLTQEEIKLLDFNQWVHPQYRERINTFYINQYKQQKVSTYQEFPVIVKRKTVWVGQNVNLLFEETGGRSVITGFLVIVRDITKQKELEEALSEANDVLNRKVEERTLSLNKSNKLLTQINEELDLFLYRSSHNLKGPLARISGLIHLLEPTLEEQGSKDYLNLIDREVSSMHRLTNQLTLYHNIYSSNPAAANEKINVESLLSSLLKQKQMECVGKQCTYDLFLSGEAIIYSDVNLLTILFDSILDNSFKYKSHVGEVHHVEVRVTTGNDWLEVKIRDNGEGVAEEIRGSLFNMFYKGSQQSGGHGMGLYLADKAIKKLKGEILVDSKGGFTEFLIRLPK